MFARLRSCLLVCLLDCLSHPFFVRLYVDVLAFLLVCLRCFVRVCGCLLA